MRRFKIGDKVTCIKNTGSVLILGEKYTIYKIYYRGNFKRVMIEECPDIAYYANRFQLNLQEQRKEKIKKLNKLNKK